MPNSPETSSNLRFDNSEVVDAEVVYSESDLKVVGHNDDGTFRYGIVVDIDENGQPVYQELSKEEEAAFRQAASAQR